MIVVVASGKGGTGKTLVATSLAIVASDTDPVAVLDADVEAPNAGLFLRPSLSEERVVEQLVPSVDALSCTHSGRCAEVCQYNAIAALPERTLVFEALCHGCGSCTINCPAEAIREVPRPIGLIEAGRANGMSFAQGTLEIGEAMATPVIRGLKRYASELGWDGFGLVVRDAPPGTACPVIEALRGADVALLVTEPTPFGLHDLKLAVEVARDVLHLPVGVVINKDGPDAAAVEGYCRDRELPIWMRIPLRRDIAVSYSVGTPLVKALPEYRPMFATLLEHLHDAANRGAV